jgi:hypothetical protein
MPGAAAVSYAAERPDARRRRSVPIDQLNGKVLDLKQYSID